MTVILSMSCSLCFVACFKMFLFFVWALFSHSFLHPSYIIPLLLSSFLSLLPLDCFVYSWQKRGEFTGEYTSLYRHFYMTHVHTIRGSNSTLCTFVRGESHRRDAYTKGEKTFFYEKTLFYFMLVSLLLYGAWVIFSIIYALVLSSHHALVP